MNGLLNLIINMLYNLSLFWDIEEQYYHRNNKLRANNKSIYYFGPMNINSLLLVMDFMQLLQLLNYVKNNYSYTVY